MRPRSSMERCENFFTSSRVRTKLRWYTSVEVVVDSGALMHLLSKKDLSSDELDTLRRSRNSATVVTANGEVQANEEAQVYVHDLGLFVTVQLLEETLAVLSLGKLCEDHGYSCEWVSGQKPRLAKEEKPIICTTGQFRTACCSRSVQFLQQIVFNIDITGLVFNKSSPRACDGLAPGHWRGPLPETQNQNQKRDGNRDSVERLRDLPEWLEEFTDNLEDTKVLAPAHISQDSDSERPTKVVSKSRRHSFL